MQRLNAAALYDLPVPSTLQIQTEETEQVPVASEAPNGRVPVAS